MRNKVINVLKEVSEYDFENLDTDQNIISSLGIDSLKMLELIVSLEDAFHIEIPEDYLVVDKFATIGTIEATLIKILEENSQIEIKK